MGVFVLLCLPGMMEASAPAQPMLVSAAYGLCGQCMDVTQTVANNIGKNATNELFGFDPVFNRRKTVSITYQDAQQRLILEGNPLQIPQNSRIIAAYYGICDQCMDVTTIISNNLEKTIGGSDHSYNKLFGADPAPNKAKELVLTIIDPNEADVAKRLKKVIVRENDVVTLNYTSPLAQEQQNLRARAIEEPETCSICLDSLSDKEKPNKILACGHMFHEACVDDWLIGQITKGETPTCPLCRRAVDQELIPQDRVPQRLIEPEDNVVIDMGVLAAFGIVPRRNIDPALFARSISLLNRDLAQHSVDRDAQVADIGNWLRAVMILPDNIDNAALVDAIRAGMAAIEEQD